MNTRQADILSILEQHGEVTIKRLAQRLGVSEMTIHRDLDVLESRRLLYKKRGAAVFINVPDRGKTVLYSAEKRAIGQMAAGYVKPGMTVLTDNSTTAAEAAKFLSDIPGLTVCTTNLEISAILSKIPGIRLYCSGGYYFPDSKGFIGSQAEDFAEKTRADICIIGASGISEEDGITNPYPMHSALQRKIIKSSSFVLLCADHSKFDKHAMEKDADLSDIDLIITDSGINADTLERYRKYVRIETAEPTD